MLGGGGGGEGRKEEGNIVRQFIHPNELQDGATEKKKEKKGLSKISFTLASTFVFK